MSIERERERRASFQNILIKTTVYKILKVKDRSH